MAGRTSDISLAKFKQFCANCWKGTMGPFELTAVGVFMLAVYSVGYIIQLVIQLGH